MKSSLNMQCRSTQSRTSATVSVLFLSSVICLITTLSSTEAHQSSAHLGNSGYKAIIVDTIDSLKNNIFSSLIRFSSGLPPSSQLLMLDMKDDRSIHEQDPDWTTQKDGLSPIWGRDGSSNGRPLCLKCVVDEFLIKLRKVDGNSADLIIVTPGLIQEMKQDVTNISESLIAKGVSLRVVIYPYTRERAPYLEPLRELVSKVRGSINLVADSIHSPVSPKLLLFDVFDSFLTNNPNIRIARQSFQVPGDVDFKFSVDRSLLSKDIQLVTFFSSSSSEVIDSVQNYYLKSNSEKITTKMHEYKASNHHFQVPLESRPAGEWTLHYSSRRNDTLTGVAYARMSGHRTPITVKCYMTDNMANVSVPEDGSPPTIFVTVSQDLKQHVQNARVEITLTNDLGNVIPYAVNIPMIDDGLGTPDITKGDGIYSLYLDKLTDPGFYGIHVTVRNDGFLTKLKESLSLDDEDEGSVVPERRHGNMPIHHLERYQDCGQIYLNEKYIAENYVGKIKDVKVESVDETERKLTLSFSPPPGNYKSYELRMFTEDKYEDISNNWERGDYVTQFSYDPFMTKRNQFVIPINNPSAGTYYFALKVFGLVRSTLSNIVSVQVGPDHQNMTSLDTGNLRGLEPWQIVAISGGAIILFILLCLCICCLCLGKKGKKSDDKEAASASKATGFGSKGGPHNPHPSSLTIHTTMGSAVNLSTEKINHSMMNHGLSTISHDQIHPHQSSELQAAMSPVQSWDAGVILDHYQKVQQAKERKETPPIMKMEEVLLARDGSCSSSSDNRESGSYDDNAFGVAHQGWRQPVAYDNGQYIGHDPHAQYLGLPHQQVLMSQGYPSMYTDQYYVDPQPPIHWQEAYTTRSQTPSDVTDSYDPRYAHPSNRRSTAAVSQV